MTSALLAPFARPGMPGASVLVMRHGAAWLRESVGLADVEAGLATTPATNFRLASLTKQFTATAVLLLVRDGALALDQSVRDVLPELPGYAHQVTIRHLLSHTSGLWDYEDFVPDAPSTAAVDAQGPVAPQAPSAPVRDADVLTLVRRHASRLYFDAGASWRYSNTGYALLALVVERLAGEPFGDVLRHRIFQPLGMRASCAHEEGRTVVPRRAWGYTVRRGAVERTDQGITSSVLGDGGLYSSVDDLARWYASLCREPLVGRALWREARTPQRLADGTPTDYGFGWFVDEYRGHERLRHHGETCGFTNAMAHFPGARVAIVVLTNRSDAVPWEVVDALADGVLPGR